ncbi:MAG: hypothetical protein H6739_37680 [Alphaproteobacteria bacterium]|nr:hypothetical protein [Alphaproteobacteria bacterium]
MSTPPLPEWIAGRDAPSSGGQDFLGLRTAAQRIGYHLLDGVTSVTPQVRYLSLRSWILDIWWAQRRPEDRKELDAFARRVEAAVVLGNLLAGRNRENLVGGDKGVERFRSSEDPISLDPVVDTPANTIYKGAAEQLGLDTARFGERVTAVNGLTPSRGAPLAAHLRSLAEETALGRRLHTEGPSEHASRADLKALGERLRLDRFQPEEVDLLCAALMPDAPQAGASPAARAQELRRTGTWCALLWLGQSAEPTEGRLWALALDPARPSPPALESVLDGWALYLVRDVLVAAHEAVMRAVTLSLGRRGDEGKRSVPAAEVLAELASAEIEAPLRDLGLLAEGERCADLPLTALAQRLVNRTSTGLYTRGGLRWWHDDLHEEALIGLCEGAPDRSLALLPLAWLLAERRARLGVEEGLADHRFLSPSGRIGMTQVVLPELDRLRAEGVSVLEAGLRLTRRTVDQHLRVAWARMRQNARSDVAHLFVDGDRWRWRADFAAGRTNSRVYNAIRWGGQLGLWGSPTGAALLTRGLRTLEAER